MMKVLVGIAQTPFIRQGSEKLAELLREALFYFGHQAEIIKIPFDLCSIGRVLDHILSCRLMDWSENGGVLGDALVALDFPVTLIRHPHKVIWMTKGPWLGPTPEVFTPDPDLHEACREAEQLALSEARRVFTISTFVSYHLRKRSTFNAIPLIPPPPSPEQYYWEKTGDFLLVPAEVRPMERLRLLFEALALTREQVRVRFCGFGNDSNMPERLLSLATRLDLQSRIELLGETSHSVLPHLFAESRAVLFPPLDEPFSWVTLQSMLASKAMITCYDSGAPAEHVEHGVTGWVVDPEPCRLAALMDDLWRHPERLQACGVTARSAVEAMPLDWGYVLEKLLGSTTPGS